MAYQREKIVAEIRLTRRKAVGVFALFVLFAASFAAIGARITRGIERELCPKAAPVVFVDQTGPVTADRPPAAVEPAPATPAEAADPGVPPAGKPQAPAAEASPIVPEPAAATAAPVAGAWVVQAGPFPDETGAKAFLSAVAPDLRARASIEPVRLAGEEWYRVEFGVFETDLAARHFGERLTRSHPGTAWALKRR